MQNMAHRCPDAPRRPSPPGVGAVMVCPCAMRNGTGPTRTLDHGAWERTLYPWGSCGPLCSSSQTPLHERSQSIHIFPQQWEQPWKVGAQGRRETRDASCIEGAATGAPNGSGLQPSAAWNPRQPCGSDGASKVAGVGMPTGQRVAGASGADSTGECGPASVSRRA